MKTGTALVTESCRLYGDVIETWFLAPEIVRGTTPGQFVMVAGGDGIDPFLRRNHSIYRLRITAQGVELGLLYKRIDKASDWLADRRPGDAVPVLGPLGRGFSILPGATNLLVLAADLGIAPLVWLMDAAIEARRNVTLIISDSAPDRVFPNHLLPAEVEIGTSDDGAHNAGLPQYPKLVEYVRWADQIFVCGPYEMHQALRSTLWKEAIRKPAQALLMASFPCGFGVCNGCTVFTRKGPRLACKDGPRFDLRDLE